jgi:DNA-directed RNA polymerase subunit RPC12/RpoP
MKLKCKKCGKKQARLMSKYDIKTTNFVGVDMAIVSKIIDVVDKIFSPDYIVCESCGHVEKA